MMFQSQIDAVAIFWDRFVYIGVAFMPMLVYHFSIVFSKIKTQKNLLILGYIFSGIFLILSRTDYFVAGVYKYSWGFHSQARFFHHIFLIFFVFYVIKSFLNILTSYRQTKSVLERSRAKYIFIAFLALASMGSIAFLPGYGIDIYPFSYLSGVIFAGVVAYAITRFRLMDIRLVAKKWTVYLVSLIVSAGIGAGLMYGIISFGGNVSWKTFGPVSLIVSLIVFLPIKSRLEIIANKYFFASLYNFQQTLVGVSKKLPAVVNLEKLSSLITNTIVKTMQVDKIALLIKNKKAYHIQKIKGFQKENSLKIEKKNSLTTYLEKNSQALLYQEINLKIENSRIKQEKQDLEKIKKVMQKTEAAAYFPCIAKNKLLGIIVLGNKLSREAYSKEDIELLESLSNQAGIAIDNALLHQEVLDFNLVLQERVRQRTKKLKKANIKLKAALRAKSEFLDIASHQLRTPTSIIRGMLSMVVAGDLNKQEEKEFIDKSFQSVNRLVVIINDLLDASEAEDEELRLNIEPVQMEGILKESVDFLTQEAGEKKLYLKLELPEQETKKILGDLERIRRVIEVDFEQKNSALLL